MTSGNPVLDENLKCIEKYNPSLRDKLLNLPFLNNDIQLVETELKEPNLSYNGIPLHSQKGAENEAKSIFELAPNMSSDINIIFGVGLGHLFKEFCDNSKGVVILYEQNVEILRVTLELVDFSNELSQKNVYVVSDFSELKKVFQANFHYKSEVYILSLSPYKKLFAEEYQDMIKEIEMLKGISTEDANMLKQKGTDFILSILDNLPNTLEATPLQEFKDIYKDKTAIVVSAGPTLDLNIETIKRNRDKLVIFCVGTAFKALMKHDIIPDFVNIIEVLDCSGQLSGFDLSEVKLIVAPYTHKSVQDLKVKQKFIFPSSATRGAQYWSYLTGIDISEYVSKGTVAYAALSSAKMLGFKKIILVGQDLAFINNSCYSKDSAYADLVFEINPQTGKPEYKIKNYENFLKSIVPPGTNIKEPWCEEFAKNKLEQLNSGTYFVKGISGEMLPTAVAYALFAELFKDFASFNQDLDLINTSMVGAQLDGFKNISLEEALKDVKPFDKLTLNTDFKYDEQHILNQLNAGEILLQNFLSDLKKVKESICNTENEIQKRKILSMSESQNYKTLLQLYDSINAKYFEGNILFPTIATGDNLEVQHYVKNTNDDKLTKQKKVYSLIKTYFAEVEKKVLKVLEAITKQKGYLNERINSKS